MSQGIHIALSTATVVLLGALTAQTYRLGASVDRVENALLRGPESDAARMTEAQKRFTEADLLAKGGQLEAAMAAYETVLTMDPGNTSAINGLEQLRVRQLLYDPDLVKGPVAPLRYAALRYQVNPVDGISAADALVALGNLAFFLENDETKARELYSGALNADNSNLNARIAMTIMTITRASSLPEGMYTDIKTAVDAVDAPPRLTLETAARLAMLENKPEEAAGYAFRARSIRPTPLSLALLAQANLTLGNVEQATSAARELVNLDPKDPGGHAVLCQAALRSKQPESALQPCSAAFDRGKDATNHLMLARALGAAGMNKEAVQAYTDLLKRDERQLPAWLEVGVLLAREGDFQAAAGAFKHLANLQAPNGGALPPEVQKLVEEARRQLAGLPAGQPPTPSGEAPKAKGGKAR